MQSADDNVVDQVAIAKWIEQLDGDSLTKRQQARRELTRAGQTAIPALTKAALSEKRDLIAHSIDILAAIAEGSGDADTEKAAKVALEVLSESDKPSTSERARLALQAEKSGGIQAFPGWDQPGGEFAGGNRFANRSVSVSNMNGLRTITIKEAGKTTTIQDQPQGKMQVRITGEGEPKQFLVANAEELKKKDPAAFALHEQYGGNAGGQNFANFGFGGIGLKGAFGNNLNMMANRVQADVPVQNNNAGAFEAKRMLIEQLTELKKRMAGNPVMQQILDQQIRELQQ